MAAPRPVQLPLSMASGSKRDSRSQFAALCFRVRDGKTQFLLITSRRTKRWILPKGWPENGLTPSECALKEAWEEAGVKGKAIDQCVGIYTYEKALDNDETLPCVAMIYPVKVTKTKKEYPEADERRRKWVSRKEAANRVNEPALKKLIRTFNPKALKK